MRRMHLYAATLATLATLAACGTSDDENTGADSKTKGLLHQRILPGREILQAVGAKQTSEAPTRGSNGIGESAQNLEAVSPEFLGLDTTVASINEQIEYYFGYIDRALSEEPTSEDPSRYEWRASLENFPGHEVVLVVEATDDTHYHFSATAGATGFVPKESDSLFEGGTEIRGEEEEANWIYALTLNLEAIDELERDATTRLTGTVEVAAHPMEDGREVFYDLKKVRLVDRNGESTKDVVTTYREWDDGSRSLSISQAESASHGEDTVEGFGRSYYRWGVDGGRLDSDLGNASGYWIMTNCWDPDGAELFAAWATGTVESAVGSADGSEDACAYPWLDQYPDTADFEGFSAIQWDSEQTWGEIEVEDPPESAWTLVIDSVEIYSDYADQYDPDSLLDPVAELVTYWGDGSYKTEPTLDAPWIDGQLRIDVVPEDVMQSGFRVTVLDFDEVESEQITNHTASDQSDGAIYDVVGSLEFYVGAEEFDNVSREADFGTGKLMYRFEPSFGETGNSGGGSGACWEWQTEAEACDDEAIQLGEALADCVCTGNCAGACGDFCNDIEPVPSEDCEACANDGDLGCGAEMVACFNDTCD